MKNKKEQQGLVNDITHKVVIVKNIHKVQSRKQHVVGKMIMLWCLETPVIKTFIRADQSSQMKEIIHWERKARTGKKRNWETRCWIPVPLLPPVAGLENGTLFVLPLGRGRVLDCTFWRTSWKTKWFEWYSQWCACLSCVTKCVTTCLTALTLFFLRGEGDPSLSDSVSL